MVFFRYRVIIEKDEVVEGEFPTLFACGLIAAENYGAAAERIEDYYGVNLVSIDNLKMINDAAILELPFKMDITLNEIEEAFVW